MSCQLSAEKGYGQGCTTQPIATGGRPHNMTALDTCHVGPVIL